jgi:hypothetical protein
MILLLALACALMWTWLRGGSLWHAQHVPLRVPGLVIAAFGIQTILIYLPLSDAARAWLHIPLLLLSFALVTIFVWQNWQLRGIKFIALGFFCNALVMAVNGGYMPVTFEALVAADRAHLVSDSATGTLVFGSKDILLPAAQTNLWLLSDIFVIPPPFPVPSVFSVGDALIALGLFRLVPFLFGASANAPTRTTNQMNSL